MATAEAGASSKGKKKRRYDHRVCEVGDCTHLIHCQSFPKVTNLLYNAWRHFVRQNQRPDFNPDTCSRICADHFSIECFTNYHQFIGGFSDRLQIDRKSAIPTLISSGNWPALYRRACEINPSIKERCQSASMEGSRRKRKLKKSPKASDITSAVKVTRKDMGEETAMTEDSAHNSAFMFTKDEPVDIEIKLKLEEATTNILGVSDIEGEVLPGNPRQQISENVSSATTSLIIKQEPTDWLSSSSQIPDDNTEQLTSTTRKDTPKSSSFTVQGLMKCDIPGCMFNTSKMHNLYAHQLRHNKASHTPHQVTLTTPTMVAKAKTESTLVTYYKCSLCEFTDLKKERVMGHMTTHSAPSTSKPGEHPLQGQSKHSQPKCDSNTESTVSFTQHSKTHVGDITSQSPLTTVGPRGSKSYDNVELSALKGLESSRIPALSLLNSFIIMFKRNIPKCNFSTTESSHLAQHKKTHDRYLSTPTLPDVEGRNLILAASNSASAPILQTIPTLNHSASDADGRKSNNCVGERNYKSESDYESPEEPIDSESPEEDPDSEYDPEDDEVFYNEKDDGYTTEEEEGDDEPIRPKLSELLRSKRKKVAPITDEILEPRKPPNYQCQQCDFSHKHRCKYEDHMRSHSGIKPYHCTIEGCNYETSNSTYLTKHMKMVHSKRKYICEICNKVLKNRIALKNHAKAFHSGPRTKKFKCSQCEFQTFRKPILIHHERTHTGDKPWKCTKCSYASTQKINLQTHMRTHTGEKPYKCTHCDYAAAHNVTLKGHMKIAHPTFIDG